MKMVDSHNEIACGGRIHARFCYAKDPLRDPKARSRYAKDRLRYATA
jgi:hypothetical protein